MRKILRKITEVRFWIIKSGVVLYLAILVSQLLHFNDVLSPAFAAVLSIKPTIYTGVKRGIEEFVVSLIAALASVIVLLILGRNTLSVVVALMVGLAATFLLNKAASAPITFFTVLYITLFPGTSFLKTAVYRFLYIFTGVGLAFIVNFVFSFFVYRDLFSRRAHYSLETVKHFFEMVVAGISSSSKSQLYKAEVYYHQQMQYFESLLQEMNDLKAEVKFHKKTGAVGESKFYRLERIMRNSFIIIQHTLDLMNIWRDYMYIKEASGKVSNISFDIISALSMIQADIESLFNAFEKKNAAYLPEKICENDVLIEEVTDLFANYKNQHIAADKTKDIMLFYSMAINIRQISSNLQNLLRHIQKIEPFLNSAGN